IPRWRSSRSARLIVGRLAQGQARSTSAYRKRGGSRNTTSKTIPRFAPRDVVTSPTWCSKSRYAVSTTTPSRYSHHGTRVCRLSCHPCDDRRLPQRLQHLRRLLPEQLLLPLVFADRPDGAQQALTDGLVFD